MKNKAIMAIVVLIGLISIACSYSVGFYVLNESDETIAVEYTVYLKGEAFGNDGTSLPSEFTPYLAEIKKWQNGDEKDWVKVTDYQVDPEKGKITVKVPPGSALVLANLHDAAVFFEDSYKEFKIEEVQIQGKNGTIDYAGTQVLKHFIEKTYTKRYIIYN